MVFNINNSVSNITTLKSHNKCRRLFKHMTRKENKFYEKLLENNNERHKIYKKLFKLVDKHYKFLSNDVTNLYIEDNKKNLYELNNIKQKILGGTYIKTVDSYKYKYELKNILEKVYKLVGGSLVDIVSSLNSGSTTVPSSAVPSSAVPSSAVPSTTDPSTTGVVPSAAGVVPSATDPAKVTVSIDEEIKILIRKLNEYLETNKNKPELVALIKTVNNILGSGDTLDIIKNNLENSISSLKIGQEQSKNKMNNIIAGFFEQFADNTPKWNLVQEYSKNVDSFAELLYLMKIENRESASDEKLELDIAIAFAKLGALFTPSAPGALANSPFNPTTREKNLARGALDRSGLVLQDTTSPTSPTTPTTTSKGGAAPEPVKSDEDKEKDAAKAAKEQNEMISQVKKDTNEILGIIGQIQSRYKKSYSFEADNIDAQDKFAESKETELKRMLTNGELSNDERTLVSKWASIKEEQKWISELDSQIKKAKELYDNVQKSITKLASVPNDPELAEIIRSLTLLNDGNLDAQVPFEKDSIPNHLAKVLTEITSAYQVVVKGYNSAGESVTKRSQQTTSSSAVANSSNASVNEANKVISRLQQKLLTITKIVDQNEDIKDRVSDKSSYETWRDDRKRNYMFTSADLTKNNTSFTAPDPKESTQIDIVKDIIAKLGYKVVDTKDAFYYENLNIYLDAISKTLDNINPPPKLELASTGTATETSTGGSNTIYKHITDISEAISQKIIRAMIRPIEMKLKTRLSPEYGILAENPTLLDDIYNRYQKSKASEGNLISAINLENLLNANDLIPSEVLKITTFDKMLFAFIIITFRLVAVTVTEYMIEKNWILSLGNGIIAFGVIYTLLFVGFVVTVNFDLWRLRILFNYVNMHVNTSIILTHLAMVWGLLGVVLLLIFNINFNMTGLSTKITTEEDKARLEYRLEMITLILWLVILLLVAVF